MLATIWMCTQEWSLISRRTTALTFDDVPPALQLAVGVRALEDAPELAVAAVREADPHVLDRLGGREPCLANGVRGGGLLDPRLDLRIERHASAAVGWPAETSRSRT